MKNKILGVIAAFALFTQQQQAQVGPAVFVLCIAAAAVGGVIYITSCNDRTRWWVVKEKGNPRAIEYVIIAKTKAEIEEDDNLAYVNGPWKSPDVAAAHANKQPVLADVLHVERSTDGRTWSVEADVECDVDSFIYQVPPTKDSTVFYRVRL